MNYHMTNEQLREKLGLNKKEPQEDYYFDLFSFCEAHDKFLGEWILPLNDGKKHRTAILDLAIIYLQGILNN